MVTRQRMYWIELNNYNMSMEIKVKVIQVMDVVTGMGKKGQWQKQSFIGETDGQYPKKICFTLWGEDKINKYDLEPGLVITVSVELESREYNGRWYTEPQAWKISWDAQARKWEPGNSPEGNKVKTTPTPAPSNNPKGDDDTDSLPF